MKRFFILAIALLVSVAGIAQNGLVAPSVDPEGDSLAIARVRARMDSIRQYVTWKKNSSL